MVIYRKCMIFLSFSLIKIDLSLDSCPQLFQFCKVGNSPLTRGSFLPSHRVPLSPARPPPPPNKKFHPHDPQIAKVCCTRLILVQKVLFEGLKVLQTLSYSTQYICISLFSYKWRQSWCKWLVFLSLSILWIGHICFKMVKNSTNVYGKGRRALWPPPQKSSVGDGGHHPPQHSQKLARMIFLLARFSRQTVDTAADILFKIPISAPVNQNRGAAPATNITPCILHYIKHWNKYHNICKTSVLFRSKVSYRGKAMCSSFARPGLIMSVIIQLYPGVNMLRMCRCLLRATSPQ